MKDGNDLNSIAGNSVQYQVRQSRHRELPDVADPALSPDVRRPL